MLRLEGLRVQLAWGLWPDSKAFMLYDTMNKDVQALGGRILRFRV